MKKLTLNSSILIVGSGFGDYCVRKSFQKLGFKKISFISRKKKISNFATYYDLNEYQKKSLNSPDIVYIASVPKIQNKIFFKLLDQFHESKIILEKPVFTSIDDNNKYKKILKIKRDNVIVNFIYRYVHEFNLLKKKLKNEEIISINIEWFFKSYNNFYNINSWKKFKSKGGGVLNYFGSHVFGYIFYFFGKWKRIKKITNQNSIYEGIVYYESFKIFIKLNCNSNYFTHHKMTIKTKENIFQLNNINKSQFNFELLKNSKKIYTKSCNYQKLNSNDDVRINFLLKLIDSFILKRNYNYTFIKDAVWITRKYLML